MSDIAEIPDLDGIEAAEGGPGQCPPGRHLMVVKEANSETKQEIVNGQTIVKTRHDYVFEAMDPQIVGKVAREGFNLWVPFSVQLYKAFLAACGFTTFKGLNTAMVKGRVVLVTVEHETFAGREGKQATSAKAKRFEPGNAALASLVSGGSTASKPVASVEGAQRVAF